MASVRDEVGVYEYSGGIVGPGITPAATVRDGGIIRTGTPPGCWGPMITPKFQGGHEVTRPVLVEGAEERGSSGILVDPVWAVFASQVGPPLCRYRLTSRGTRGSS